MRLNLKKQSAFTLIEILIAIFIASITLASIGISINALHHVRVDESLYEGLINWFSYAQKHAVTRGKTYSAIIDERESLIRLTEYSVDSWITSTLDINTFQLPEDYQAKFKFKRDILSMLQFYPDFSYTPFELVVKKNDVEKKLIFGDGLSSFKKYNETHL